MFKTLNMITQNICICASVSIVATANKQLNGLKSTQFDCIIPTNKKKKCMIYE